MKYILLLPVSVFFIIFTIWPLGEVVSLSMYKTNFIVKSFIGLDNYIALLQDKVFIQSFINAFFYSILIIPGQLIISLSLALGLYSMPKKWQDISRIIFYIPVLSGGIILAQIWKWVFHVDGVVNWLLNIIGIQSIFFFAQGATAIPTISFIVVACSFGAYLIIILANILSIDTSIFEAARIDGANELQICTKIILPLIIKTIWLVIFLLLIASFQIFENIYALAPQSFAATPTFFIYEMGFKFSKYGAASAQSIILLLVIFLLSLGKRKLEHEI